MSAGSWIALAGILTSAIIALVVAHLHRKQMRQIEAYRSNPEVGLVPPPHPIVKFLKRYSTLLAIGGPSAAVLAMDAFKSGPLTRGTVAWMVLAGINIAEAFALQLIQNIQIGMFDMMDILKLHMRLLIENAGPADPQQDNIKTDPPKS